MQALKALGQNFLTDPDLAARIAALGDLQTGDKVWEVGPGKGILTDAILRQEVKLRAFELDRRLPDYLTDRYGERVDFVFADVLTCDWPKLIDNDGSPLKLIANIPYQITSPLLALLERHGSAFNRVVLMLQKEVAQRLAAGPGTKSYGALGIRLRIHFHIAYAFQVRRQYFDPQPKVDSAVIVMTPREPKPQIKYPDEFARILSVAFAHRRKTLGNNLKERLGKPATTLLQQRSNLDFQRRGESLEEAEFILLSELMAAL